jgi:hypothetical protein
MIGSLMSRMADAEKLSVAQLNQAVKNGTIPAYVGVPLIQEKLKAEQAAKAMVAQTQAQPPIARQVMEQADVMSGLEKLRSNLPEEGFAGGGIVAFADGGELDLEDEDEEKNLMGRLMAGITSLKSAMPESYEAELAKKGQTPASARKLMIDGPKKGDYVMPPLDSQRPGPSRGGHKYEDMVVAEAQRIGLDPGMALHVLYKETGNLKNPESARSKAGALGVMQLMPKTAKSLGVDPLNPEENIRGGVMYLKQMYDKYQDPTLAFAAYNAGPGRVDKALKSGQGITSLPRETQNYVMASNRMAGGGIVAFQNTGLVDTDYENMDPLAGIGFGYADRTRAAEMMALDEIRREEALKKKEGAAVAPAPTAQTTPQKEAPAPTPLSAPEPYKEPPADSGLADIKNLLKQRMEESGKQKRIDAYLSLLQAGLGMMGGTSPFAAANIGQGAAQGVAAQMAARKSQVADENAILTGQLGLSRAELYEKMRRDALKQQYEKNVAERGLAERRLGVQQQAQNIRLGDLRRKAADDWENSPRKAQLEADLAKQKKNWRQDPKLLGQFESARGRFINEFVNVGQADNILSSSQL